MQTDPTVFIVDDDEAVCDSLSLLIESAGYRVNSFASAEDFLQNYTEDCNACLLLDIRMPGMSGLQLQKELLKRNFTLPVIFITGHGDVPMAVDAIKWGAADFLLKPFLEQDVLDRINDALKNLPQKFHDIELQHEISMRIARLTRREAEIMIMLAEGKANKVIAIELDISQRTVEVHRARVMEKMQVRSLAQLVQLLMQVNYLSPQ